MKQLDKVYDPKNFEKRIYQEWEDHGYFQANQNAQQQPYTIVIPPPNITGKLHMGHALDQTLQDILIRFKRMQGYCALWIPGTDHASIATEVKIVEELKKKGLDKQTLGREAFLNYAWKWKEQYGGHILGQLKQLGSSCDWSRERFTLDEGCSKAVEEVFVRLYHKGLIYQGERIIHWCPDCATSISDAEVVHAEQEGFFWHLRYPLVDGSGFVTLATTRPETMFGDTAVAVHPEDQRYQHLIGKMVTLPLTNRQIPIVADDYVDQTFGTGVVKITPAHDPNDFEVGKRHDLEMPTVMTPTGQMTEDCGCYAGMDRYEARKVVVKDLEQQGFLVKVQPHTHQVGQCYRCATTIEPRLSTQWFVRMHPLAKPALEVVRQGNIQFVPQRFEKIYFHWMENIKDWCISRQLWWGHRIPAYYCQECGQVVVHREAPSRCPSCQSEQIKQDEDTLDTWFSSALWPFSVLGFPDQTEDLSYFYPTHTLVTGYDIIFFWVARMIFSALEHTKQPPFKTVLIHGLVRDEQGRKMSKSLGNGIDPLEVIETYGADALRFMLINGNAPGNDLRYSEEKVKAARNFANKLWNATRFIQMNLPDDFMEMGLPDHLNLEDQWILSHLNGLVKETTENLEKFEFGMALSKIYDFIWNYLCDWYIELTKASLQIGGQVAQQVQQVLLYVMKNSLKLLHPFMPFITEEIWKSLPTNEESIMMAGFPVYASTHFFEQEQQDFNQIIDAIKAIRTARTEKNIPSNKYCDIYIETVNLSLYQSCQMLFQRLASVSEVKAYRVGDMPNALQLITPSARIFLPMHELVDVKQELVKLQREKQSCEKEMAIITGKLSNEKFILKAPEQVVYQQREKKARMQKKLENIHKSLKSLQDV